MTVTFLRSNPPELLCTVASDAASSGSTHGTQKGGYSEVLNARTVQGLEFGKKAFQPAFFSASGTTKSHKGPGQASMVGVQEVERGVHSGKSQCGPPSFMRVKM